MMNYAGWISRGSPRAALTPSEAARGAVQLTHQLLSSLSLIEPSRGRPLLVAVREP